ncbi:MAG: VCBS repeat-containing protein, partial [Ekhidna sp.]|nr:VCBS repeat-containing protein [Ekhidna sp.]
MLCLAFGTASAQFTFTEQSGTPFAGVSLGSIAFADVDKDGHPDVLITGNDGSKRIANLYVNDGSGGFTLKTATPFAGVSSSSIAFADVNKDGHQDVLITGAIASGVSSSNLYLNNGSGGFAEKTEGVSFADVVFSSIAFADVDGENGPDVLITGGIGIGKITNLYLNNGSGGFSLKATPFTEVQASSIAFADVDGENGPDVLITGNVSRNKDIANLYVNDGEGGFTLKATPFAEVSSGSIAFADVNKDRHQDVLITGNTGSKRIANLYVNDGSGGFTLKTTPFTGVNDGSIAFADVDKDDDPDVLITGSRSTDGSERIAKLYLNDGAGGFTEKEETPFTEVSFSSIAFADVDGDDDPDVLITGDTGSGRIAKLYINDQAPVFSSESSASVLENTTAVLTVSADDTDSEMLTYSLGGADGSRFSIDDDTGDLTFNTAPDAEAPGSVDGDNVYEVEVTASDGVNDATQTITVTVTDVNEFIPMITSNNTKNVVEGTTTVLTVTATDADATAMISYSLSSGADRSLFSINQNSGALMFNTAPDFEAPGSVDGDNTYVVQVTANDGTRDSSPQ